MTSKSIKDFLKTALSLALGAAIIWLLYRKTDMKALWDIVVSANFGIIAVSLLFGLLGNYLRGLRWELLINSLGYKPKRASIVFATFGNYAVNFLLPRAGDLWRCGIVTKYDDIPFAKTLETFVVDKILDILASILLVVVSLAFSVDFFIEYFKTHPDFTAGLLNVLSSVWLYLGLATAIMVVYLLFTIFKENWIVRKIKNFLQTVQHDMKLIAGMKKKGTIISYTILAWLSFYLYFYICFYAFDFTRGLSFIVGWIVFTMSNIGVAVPVQGGIGTWHFMVISSLVVFGLTYEQAGAFAGTVFTVQAVWIIILGVIGILALPYVKRDKSKDSITLTT